MNCALCWIFSYFGHYQQRFDRNIFEILAYLSIPLSKCRGQWQQREKKEYRYTQLNYSENHRAHFGISCAHGLNLVVSDSAEPWIRSPLLERACIHFSIKMIYTLIRGIHSFVCILSTKRSLCPSLVYVRTSCAFGTNVRNGTCPSFNIHFPI